MRDRCLFLPHHQPASFEHSSIVNLGGILRTTYDVVWPLRLWITFMILSTIAVLIDLARMAEADAVLIRCVDRYRHWLVLTSAFLVGLLRSS